MKYVDAGYIICIGALFVSAVALVLRRRRLERAVELSRRDALATAAALTAAAEAAGDPSAGDRLGHQPATPTTRTTPATPTAPAVPISAAAGATSGTEP